MKKLSLLLVLIFLINLDLIYADLNIKIIINDSFNIGEQVNFNYTITSNINQHIKFIPHSKCLNAPIAFFKEKNINLIANQSYSDIYQDITIDDSIEPQICTAYIQILEPIQQKVEKTFEIKTNPSFSFEIVLAKKIFVLNDIININYNSELENPEVTTILIYPNKKKKTISLPYLFKPTQLGTYNLEVTTSKEGYKTINKRIQFGVIEKEANIPYIKEIPEKIIKEKEFPYLISIIISSLMILLVIILLFYYKYKSK